jgi:hypothetical protein
LNRRSNDNDNKNDNCNNNNNNKLVIPTKEGSHKVNHPKLGKDYVIPPFPNVSV